MPLDPLDRSLFVRAAALGNISAAGRDLGMSAAVASTRLAGLEKELGARLLHRTTRRVSLAEDGAAFLPRAQDVLDAIEAARGAVGGGASLKGTLRVAAPVGFGRLHIVPGLQDFLDRHPQLHLDLRLTDALVDLAEGGIDVAIRVTERPESGLSGRHLAPNRLVVCAAPAYLTRHGAPVVPADLRGHDCLVLGEMRQWVFRTPDGAEGVEVSGRLRLDSAEGLREAVRHGLGIGILSTWHVGELLQGGQLVRLLDGFPLMSERALWALTLRSRLTPLKVRSFVEHCAGRFGPEPYWDVGLVP